MTRFWTALTCLAALFAVVVHADLPVHCVHDQVLGDWDLYLDAGGSTSAESCGHSQPDEPDYLLKHPYPIQPRSTLRLSLLEPNIVVDPQGKRGTWTIVYDEGFEISIYGQKFFAFFKYVLKNHQHWSVCGETLVGWYHTDSLSDWGCYYAKKTTPIAPQLSPDQGPAVVAPDDVSMLAETASHAALKKMTFTPGEHSGFVDRLNQAQSSWKAEPYEQFRGMSLSELNSMAGNSKENRGNKARAIPNRLPGHPAHLPRSWDWRNVNGQNYAPEIRQQGSCGSCFAMSTVAAFEARLRILTNNADQTVLSPQNVLSCSRLNQACDGGYPFLVAKHAHEIGLVAEDSLPYQASSDVACSQTKPGTPVYRASNYTYVGGFYGACSEHAMMEEIVTNGPVTASFEPPFDFMMYRSGVYSAPSRAVLAEISEHHHRQWHIGWEKVDHSVAIVGYGETEEGEKYWIIQNTWGSDWGENGYFRMKRGTDEAAIESITVAVMPQLSTGGSFSGDVFEAPRTAVSSTPSFSGDLLDSGIPSANLQ